MSSGVGVNLLLSKIYVKVIKVIIINPDVTFISIRHYCNHKVLNEAVCVIDNENFKITNFKNDFVDYGVYVLVNFPCLDAKVHYSNGENFLYYSKDPISMTAYVICIDRDGKKLKD